MQRILRNLFTLRWIFGYVYHHMYNVCVLLGKKNQLVGPPSDPKIGDDRDGRQEDWHHRICHVRYAGIVRPAY